MADAESRGARVHRTGIALVHEGELVLPASGSLAEAEQVLADVAAVVHYHFPVEIEVRNIVRETDAAAVVEQALGRLAQGLEGT